MGKGADSLDLQKHSRYSKKTRQNTRNRNTLHEMRCHLVILLFLSFINMLLGRRCIDGDAKIFAAASAESRPLKLSSIRHLNQQERQQISSSCIATHPHVHGKASTALTQLSFLTMRPFPIMAGRRSEPCLTPSARGLE